MAAELFELNLLSVLLLDLSVLGIEVPGNGQVFARSKFVWLAIEKKDNGSVVENMMPVSIIFLRDILTNIMCKPC